jgi:hypothetical protein
MEVMAVGGMVAVEMEGEERRDWGTQAHLV